MIHPTAVVEMPPEFIPDDADIRPLVYVGPDARIGRHVCINHQCHISTGTIIEDDVFFGPGVITTNTRHIVFGRKYEEPRSPITIKRGARIGAGCTILPGVVIGEESEIGAGSVVTKSTKPFGRYWGNPAEYKGDVREAERYVR